MDYYYINDSITDVIPEDGVKQFVGMGSYYVSIVTDKGEVVFHNDAVMFYTHAVYLNDRPSYRPFYDIFNIIADKIPLDIYESRDTLVFRYVLDTVTEVLDGLDNYLQSVKSRLLGGKSANN